MVCGLDHSGSQPFNYELQPPILQNGGKQLPNTRSQGNGPEVSR